MANDEKFRRFITKSFQQHINCDWGKIDKDTQRENEQAVVSNVGMVYGVYHYNNGEKIVRFKTDLDKGQTTVLFFDESSF